MHNTACADTLCACTIGECTCIHPHVWLIPLSYFIRALQWLALDLSWFFLKVDPETFKGLLRQHGNYLRLEVILSPLPVCLTSGIHNHCSIISHKGESTGSRRNPLNPGVLAASLPHSTSICYCYYWRPHSNMIAGWSRATERCSNFLSIRSASQVRFFVSRWHREFIQRCDRLHTDTAAPLHAL